MNLNLSLANMAARLKNSSTILFWIAFVVLVILELLVLRRSLSIMAGLHDAPPPLLADRSVRVNFEVYDEVVKRIDGGQAAASNNPPVAVSNPFQ